MEVLKGFSQLNGGLKGLSQLNECFKGAFPIKEGNHSEPPLWKERVYSLFNLNEHIFQYSKGNSLDNFPLQMKLYALSTDSKIIRVIYHT